MKFPFTFPENYTFDVFGFGTNAVDFLITLPEFPEFGSKVELIDYTRAVGGEIASTLVGLQRLGIKTAYAGSFGDDDAGTFGMQSLELEGINLTCSKRVTGASTQIAFILIDERSGERTVIWKRDARLAFTEADVFPNAVAASRILHMTPHDADACIRLAKIARENGTLVSLDIDNIFERLDELLPHVDILICSSEFPKLVTGLDSHGEALTEIGARFGNAVIGLTLGEKGSLLLCGEEFLETPGFAVPGGCKDTTGAGDAFRAGLLYGILKGESVESAAVTANAVAALKCREVGARTALPDPDELNSFLRKS